MSESKLTLTLKPVKTVLNKLVCHEKIDVDILNKLTKSNLLREDFHNPMCQDVYKNELEQLNKYKSLIDTNGYANVKYSKSKGMSFGRVFPNKSLGFISIRREIRQTLAKKNYIDIDIENCHPNMLVQICEENGLECKYIKRYVEQREKYLKHVINYFSVDREKAKNLFIVLLYGGSFKKWVNDNNFEFEDNSLTRFLINYEKNIEIINKQIIKNNPLIEKELKENEKEIKKCTTMSYFLQEYECRVITCVYEYLVENNVIINNDCAICLDGIMIRKDKYNESLLTELNKVVYEKIVFNLTFTQKEMKQDYLNILDDNIIDVAVPVDGYENKKKIFEQNHFKLMNPIRYVTILKDNTLIQKKKPDFINTYENVYYTGFKEKEDKDGNITYTPVQEQFIYTWMKDTNIKTFNKIDFLPRMETPEGVYNTFTDFNAVNKPKKNINIENTLMYKHLNNLCGNDSNVFNYVIKWLANRIQTPYDIPRTALLFKSVDGCGKDLFFDWFGKMVIGEDYYHMVEDIEALFGKFNDIIKDKILIVGNEIQASRTINLNENIKYAVTATVNNIETKGNPIYKNKNNIGYVFLTNNDFPIKISKTDRRYVAIKSNNSIANNDEYFTNLRKELNSGDIDRAFYDYLMSIDLSEINFTTDRPITDYYEDIKLNFLEPHILFINELLRENINNEMIEKQAMYLFKDFQAFIQERNIKYEITHTKFGLKLKEFTSIEKIITKKYTKYMINVKNLIEEFKKLDYLIEDFYNIVEDDNKPIDFVDEMEVQL